MNSVILIGNLTRDPELNYTPGNQTAVCKFDIAVNRPKKNGEDQGADFIRVIVWGRQAESCNKYLSKGRQAAVKGRINTGSYTDRNGNKVYTTDVIAEQVEFLGSHSENSRSDERNNNSGNTYQQPTFDMPDNFAQAEDDCPF